MSQLTPHPIAFVRKNRPIEWPQFGQVPRTAESPTNRLPAERPDGIWKAMGQLLSALNRYGAAQPAVGTIGARGNPFRGEEGAP